MEKAQTNALRETNINALRETNINALRETNINALRESNINALRESNINALRGDACKNFIKSKKNPNKGIIVTTKRDYKNIEQEHFKGLDLEDVELD